MIALYLTQDAAFSSDTETEFHLATSGFLIDYSYDKTTL